jgi:hypothetical protein
MNIQTRHEAKRGCGFRKLGGLYLVSGLTFGVCGKLPLPLTVCPCCHAGIKPARGWTWVSHNLFRDVKCDKDGCVKGCVPFDGSVDMFGLIWIGEKYYPTPGSFLKEGIAQGISRRISALPKDFKLGETWVLLAHRKGIRHIDLVFGEETVHYTPAIFTAFKPTAIEYVVKDDDDEEKLERMEKKGITLIRVKPLQTEMELE